MSVATDGAKPMMGDLSQARRGPERRRRFEQLGGRSMQVGALGDREVVVQGVAHEGMREAEADDRIARLDHEPARDRLGDERERFRSVEARETSDRGQIELASEHGGAREETPRRFAQRIEAATHRLAHLDPYALEKLAVLRDGQGQEVPALRLESPSGSGHHREGVLSFPAMDADGKPLVSPEATAVTLILRGIGGVPERAFQWPLGAGAHQ